MLESPTGEDGEINFVPALLRHLRQTYVTFLPNLPLSSAAVVKTKLREEKTLAGFDLTGHSGTHIQPELVNPIYAAGYSITT